MSFVFRPPTRVPVHCPKSYWTPSYAHQAYTFDLSAGTFTLTGIDLTFVYTVYAATAPVKTIELFMTKEDTINLIMNREDTLTLTMTYVNTIDLHMGM